MYMYLGGTADKCTRIVLFFSFYMHAVLCFIVNLRDTCILIHLRISGFICDIE
jgi:hypothetical protein